MRCKSCFTFTCLYSTKTTCFQMCIFKIFNKNFCPQRRSRITKISNFFQAHFWRVSPQSLIPINRLPERQELSEQGQDQPPVIYVRQYLGNNQSNDIQKRMSIFENRKSLILSNLAAENEPNNYFWYIWAMGNIYFLRMGNNMVLVNKKVDRRGEYKKYAFTESIKDLGQTKI